MMHALKILQVSLSLRTCYIYYEHRHELSRARSSLMNHAAAVLLEPKERRLIHETKLDLYVLTGRTDLVS